MTNSSPLRVNDIFLFLLKNKTTKATEWNNRWHFTQNSLLWILWCCGLIGYKTMRSLWNQRNVEEKILFSFYLFIINSLFTNSPPYSHNLTFIIHMLTVFSFNEIAVFLFILQFLPLFHSRRWTFSRFLIRDRWVSLTLHMWPWYFRAVYIVPWTVKVYICIYIYIYSPSSQIGRNLPPDSNKSKVHFHWALKSKWENTSSTQTFKIQACFRPSRCESNNPVI